MSGHGGFSVIGSGMKVPQPLAMPKVEELQPGKDKRNALNVEGHKAEAQIADTRLDQTNRLAANLDTMLLRAAKTASAPVDVKALKVTVKGIDNDACYSQYRTGATRFSFDKGRADLFKAKLLNVATKIDSGHANDEYAHLLADLGITADENGGLTIDASKVQNKAVIYALKGVTGAKTLAVPDKIDSETYNALMELKAGPKRDAYLDSIRPRLSQDSYNAAVSRLDDVIAHAEKLKGEGKIVQGNGWQHVRETPLRTGKVTVQNRNGQNKQIGGDIASVVNELSCPSYFARDKLSKIFK